MTSASDIAAKLDDAVQGQFRAWLIRDAKQRVDEVLTWLPEDTESFIVNQAPFTINGRAPADPGLEPAQLYVTDRLVALNGGAYYAALKGVTIRIAVAGTRNIRDRFQGSDPASVPALMSRAEVAYFYFLSEPLDPDLLGPSNESIGGRPAWTGTATVDAGRVAGGRRRVQSEDTSWLALARPDILVLASGRELLGQAVERVQRGSKTRALPANLPEWAEVDRGADF